MSQALFGKLCWNECEFDAFGEKNIYHTIGLQICDSLKFTIESLHKF